MELTEDDLATLIKDACIDYADGKCPDFRALARNFLAAHNAGAQEPVGYLPAYELERLQSGHDANLRSAKFGASHLDGDVAVYLAQPQPMPDAALDALPAEVMAWRDAYQQYVDTVAVYNERVAYVKDRREKHGVFEGVDPEYQAMTEAQRTAMSLLKPMHAALAEIERLDRAKGE